MKSWIHILSFSLLLSACTTPPSVTPTSLPIAALTPWSSPTPAAIIPSAAPVEVEPVSLPTLEPRTHIIEKGEDLGGLALKYGVSLAEIMAANPEIDPRMISIGTAIIIPSAASEESAAAPQAAEAGVSIQPPHCLLNAGGGLTCFSAVRNEHEAPVENISLNFILLDAEQNEITSQLSYAPLNLLPTGAAMPFLANFQGPLPSSYSIRADLAGALPGAGSPERYLNHSLEGASAEIAADGLSARVSGQVQLAPDQANAGTTWVLAVGYNRAGDVICLRRWEDTAGIEAGQGRTFEFTIYSSREKIERVEFLSESRP
ncbi:MAG: LysM peptidoglycan-binding domain-containing protein [Anaerolineaceae bacterium]